jgi:hypothetical protein
VGWEGGAFLPALHVQSPFCVPQSCPNRAPIVPQSCPNRAPIVPQPCLSYLKGAVAAWEYSAKQLPLWHAAGLANATHVRAQDPPHCTTTHGQCTIIMLRARPAPSLCACLW